MYNRYIPQPDGSFRRNRVQESQRPEPSRQTAPSPPVPLCDPPPPCPGPKAPVGRQGGSITGFLKQLLPKGLDTGDLLIIILLLLMAGDCAEDQNTALLTLVLYLFL